MTEQKDERLQMKINSAKEALKFISENIILGVGSGSTIREFIKLLKNSTLKFDTITCIPSSLDTEHMLIEQGFRLGTLNQYPEIDVTIDGADRVDKELNLIKGGGGALLQEKLLAFAAKKVIIIVDYTKLTQNLAGSFPIPVEVIPKAQTIVEKELIRIGGEPKLRLASDKLGPTITDNGNVIFDTNFTLIESPEELEKKLNNIPGVVENGLFPKKLISQIIVADNQKIRILTKS